jgi:hypothetical protein
MRLFISMRDKGMLTFVLRPNTVFPTVTGYKISAGITNDRNIQCSDSFNGISPKTRHEYISSSSRINIIINWEIDL